MAAEGFDVDRHAVAGAYRMHGLADLLNHADHLMPDRYAGHGARHGAMLDMQVAGADAGERDAHNRVPRVAQSGHRLVQQGEMPLFYIGVC